MLSAWCVIVSVFVGWGAYVHMPHTYITFGTRVIAVCCVRFICVRVCLCILSLNFVICIGNYGFSPPSLFVCCNACVFLLVQPRSLLYYVCRAHGCQLLWRPEVSCLHMYETYYYVCAAILIECGGSEH